MNSNLNEIIKNPINLIQSIFNSENNSENNSIDSIILNEFKSLFLNDDSNSISQIPTLNSLSNSKNLPPLGSLIRFRAMIQDTGFGREVFKAISNEGIVLSYGNEQAESVNEDGSSLEDYSNLMERQSMYIISIPGENDWLKENLDSSSLDTSIKGLSISNSTTTNGSTTINSSGLTDKFPIISENHFGCIAKFYGEMAEQVKTCDTFEFIGILSESSVSTPFDDLVSSSSSSSSSTPQTPQSIPALHVIFSIPIKSPTFSSAPTTTTENSSVTETLRSELIDYLAQGVEGDKEAAEWVLLSLLGRIHTRHATGLPLGPLTLNLAYPNHFKSPSPPTILSQILNNLTPKSIYIPLSIPILNNLNFRIAPRNKDENLESGSLQVGEGTVVVVDFRGVDEGVLGDGGVKNLRNLQTSLTSQKLPYEFPYSSFELEINLNFILLSEGKAIVATDCLVYIKPTTTASSTANVTPISESKLNQFRSFLYSMRESNFVVPVEMSEVIQSDFVTRRQKSVGGEAMSQEDLLFRMTVARLMTLSHGSNKMDELNWVRTAELDERRKE